MHPPSPATSSPPLLTLCCSAGLQNAIFAVANLFIQAGVNRFDA